MSERAPYSRVYWAIIDDEKFKSIYDDNNHLASWMRLLLIADQAWPASAHMPANVRRASVAALVKAELIDLLDGGRYRIRGLDAERARRRMAATRDPIGVQPGRKRDPDGLRTPGLSRDEVRRDETSSSPTDPHTLFERLTGRYPSPVNQAILDESSALFGAPSRTCAELVAAAAADKDWTTLAKRVKNVALREEHGRRQDEARDERTRNAAKRAPLPSLRFGNTADISDEEAERLAREHLRRSA
jgi:hypothetical protein